MRSTVGISAVHGGEDVNEALTPHEHAPLTWSAFDAAQGKPDYPLLTAASIAARLAADPRMVAVLGYVPCPAQLYRLQRDTTAVDLLALVHHAQRGNDSSAAQQLRAFFKPSIALAQPVIHAPHPLDQPAQSALALPRRAQPGKPAAKRRAYPVPQTESSPLQTQPKMHVYRAKTALTVEWGSASRTPALFIQVARRAHAQAQFDWTKRINVALTASESFDFLQVCLGRTEFAELKFHGPERNKSVELKTNPDTSNNFALLIRVREAGTGSTLGLTGFDVASLVQLLSLSVASKLPVPGDALVASRLAQTSAPLR